jgi:hypothetical protein
MNDLTEAEVQEVRTYNDKLFGDSLGVHQAVFELKKSLKELTKLMEEEKYEEASSLGYRGVTTNFVFLQRCLAGIQSLAMDLSRVIIDVAERKGLSYEEAEPLVNAVLTEVRKVS